MLAKIRFSPWNRSYFISAIWNLSFILVSSMIIIMMIDGSLTDLFLPIAGNIDLNEELVCCKTHQHKQHQIDVSGVTSGFVMHFGYFMSSTIYAIGQKSYKSLEFLRKQIIFAIILLTYYSKCPLYGLCILLISHRSSLLQNATKLCILVGHHTNSARLAAFSLGIFVYYGAIWFVSFVIELPMFLSRNKTIESSMMFAELNLLIIIHGLVVMYVIISLFEGLTAVLRDFTNMDRNTLEHSSEIRDVLDKYISNENDTSDIEAPDIPSDISLLDFSSGSGEEYEPDPNELSS
ncbi:hypothetical protein J6590_019562 [Homalodisca vitripennis]|nr:hypothetical protein J6590_019562 [Homalodisca vitripennis]